MGADDQSPIIGNGENMIHVSANLVVAPAGQDERVAQSTHKS